MSGELGDLPQAPSPEEVRNWLQVVHDAVTAYIPEPWSAVVMAAVPLSIVLWIVGRGLKPFMNNVILPLRRKK